MPVPIIEKLRTDDRRVALATALSRPEMLGELLLATATAATERSRLARPEKEAVTAGGRDYRLREDTPDPILPRARGAKHLFLRFFVEPQGRIEHAVSAV